jgi:hypothetical protein
MLTKENMTKIKVEISLAELCDLKEKAEFYFNIIEERDLLYKEINNLKQKYEVK